MKKNILIKLNFNFSLLLFLALCPLTPSMADIVLPPLVGDNMVLQRRQESTIWGWASKGEKIVVNFNNTVRETTAAENKMWSVKFPAMSAGGPYTMTIKGENEIMLSNIMVGDVWLCSGQSNMSMTMAECAPNYKNESQHGAEYKDIRLIKIKNTATSKPFEEFVGSEWQMPSDNNLWEFSAVAYFFAKELYDKYKLPIGLISSNWGGSPAEVWMSAEALQPFPEIYTEYKNIEETQAEKVKTQMIREKNLNAWVAEARGLDEGFQEDKAKWYESHLIEKDWKIIPVPEDWNNQGLGNFDGIVWFRKEITLPASAAKKPLELDLGYIDDLDVTWFNGSVVGNQDNHDDRRIYKIPAELVREGKNIIAVRVIDHGGGGGISGNMKLKGENLDMSLAGEWKYRIGYNFNKMPKFTPPDFTYNFGWKPSYLFNGMIYPLLKYKIKGAIWYQGESNVHKAKQYQKLFPAMIADWRKKWDIGDFPFLYVQLANFVDNNNSSPIFGQSPWAELREAQEKTLSMPNTGMIPAIDLGNRSDIHPKNKQEVGKRLAHMAMKVAYHDKEVNADAPKFEKMTNEGLRVRLHFANVGTGLMIKGEHQSLKNFIMAGADKKFYAAKAYLEGNTIVVDFPKEVSAPMSIRYAWSNSPENCTIFSKEGLPLLPFRTDNWEGVTK